MDIVLSSLAFLIAAVCAGTMGFAIQRGATCTVAASRRSREQATFQSPDRNGRGVDLGRRRACAGGDLPPAGKDAVGLPAELS